MIPPKVRSWLIHLYPRVWQNRYADEFDALLEQCLHTPLDVVDMFLGAMDAHLQLLSGENVNWRLMNMLNKLRTTILIVFVAYIGFIIAGFCLVGLADDSPMISLMKTNTGLAAAWATIQFGAVAGLLSIVIGGLPLAVTIIRRALTTDRRNLGLLLVPAYALLALVLYAGLIIAVGKSLIHIPGVLPAVQPGNFPPGNRLMLAGLLLVFILGAILSSIAVWKAITRTDIEQETFRAIGHEFVVKVYKFAFWPAVIASVSMLVMLCATVAWGLLAFSALPQVFVGNFGLWQTSTQAWFIGIIVVMILSTLAAFYGLVRSRSAWKAA
jgi:hypothetical protein